MPRKSKRSAQVWRKRRWAARRRHRGHIREWLKAQ
jgi:hypothetical protein